MPYLNIDLNYFTHIKTSRLARLLGKGAEVLPVRLWAYVGKHHADDGNLTGYSTQEVEAIVEWWGDEGVFVKAMLSVRFLEGEDGNYVIHDWLEHNGHIKALKERGRTAAKARWDRINEAKNYLDEREVLLEHRLSNANGDGKQSLSIQQALLSPYNSNAPAKPSLPSVPTIPTMPAKLEESASRSAHVDNLLKKDFLLRTTEEELKYLEGIIFHLIETENIFRQENPFEWTPATGSLLNDLRSLMYKIPDDEKKSLLQDNLNVIETFNWAKLIFHGVKITIRRSEKEPIHSPFAFVMHLLRHPADVASHTFDGALAQGKIK